MDILTKEDLKRMILFSCDRIERDKDQINKINVFPVPDQDTGSNMAATLKGIKEVIEKKEFKDIEEFSSAVLDGAMTSAQGNAGIIYTGFLAGFLPCLDKDKIDKKCLAEALKKGAERARQSIQHPKAGTILDVIDAASFAAEESEEDVEKTFVKIVGKAHEALMATREKMEIYKKANVVDAGGLGFLMILESYVDALNNKAAAAKTEEWKPSEKVRRIIQILSNRYEIISLIENPKMEEKTIRDKLKNLGNCLDIVRVKEKMRIHIHTDFPDEVKNILISAGQIQSLRMEDMAKEVAGEESVKKVSIGVVVDDLADLTQKIIERYKIEVVPTKVVWPEGEDLKGENLYQKMEEAQKKGIKNLPTTSQASPKLFAEAYKKQLKNFEKVLCIPFSSKLSGDYNSALQAKTMMAGSSSQVHVFDSLNASAGQALLVLRAIELIQSQTEMEGVIEGLGKESQKIRLLGIIADPKWLEWGGRISNRQANWIRGFKKFGAIPLLGMKEGKIEKAGMSFKANDMAEALFEKIEKSTKDSRKEGKRIRAVINHCDNLAGANKLKAKLKGIGAEISFMNFVGSTIGVHVGPGALIAAWTEME